FVGVLGGEPDRKTPGPPLAGKGTEQPGFVFFGQEQVGFVHEEDHFQRLDAVFDGEVAAEFFHEKIQDEGGGEGFGLAVVAEFFEVDDEGVVEPCLGVDGGLVGGKEDKAGDLLHDGEVYRGNSVIL